MHITVNPASSCVQRVSASRHNICHFTSCCSDFTGRSHENTMNLLVNQLVRTDVDMTRMTRMTGQTEHVCGLRNVTCQHFILAVYF